MLAANARAYVAQDRLGALARGETLPDRACGAVLFADISGFTPFADLYRAEGETERALALLGLARSHPAWNSVSQRGLDEMLALWALDPGVVEAGMARGAKLDWEATLQALARHG